jgi:hypothetical protein
MKPIKIISYISWTFLFIVIVISYLVTYIEIVFYFKWKATQLFNNRKYKQRPERIDLHSHPFNPYHNRNISAIIDNNLFKIWRKNCPFHMDVSIFQAFVLPVKRKNSMWNLLFTIYVQTLSFAIL